MLVSFDGALRDFQELQDAWSIAFLLLEQLLEEDLKLFDKAPQVETEVQLLFKGESPANCVKLFNFLNCKVVAGQKLVT